MEYYSCLNPWKRAIGVIYRPDTELVSHYFQGSLSNQFDSFIWFNKTEAVTPLEENYFRQKGMDT